MLWTLFPMIVFTLLSIIYVFLFTQIIFNVSLLYLIVRQPHSALTIGFKITVHSTVLYIPGRSLILTTALKFPFLTTGPYYRFDFEFYYNNTNNIFNPTLAPFKESSYNNKEKITLSSDEVEELFQTDYYPLLCIYP